MKADTPLFDLYLDKTFLTPEACRALVDELVKAPETRGNVYGRGQGGAVDERMRKVAQIAPDQETVQGIVQRLVQARDAVAAHFGLTLTECEEPQFLRYREGDFFVAHQDGNTGLLRGGKEQSRKVSVVVFLNEPSDEPEAGGYAGGTLRFTEWRANRARGEYGVLAEAGMLVAFMADTTHEVTPVTWGDRYTIASWYG